MSKRLGWRGTRGRVTKGLICRLSICTLLERQWEVPCDQLTSSLSITGSWLEMESRAQTRPTESKSAFSHSPGRILCTRKVEKLFFILGKLSSPFSLTSSDPHPRQVSKMALEDCHLVSTQTPSLSPEPFHSEGLSWSPGIYFSSKCSRMILTLGKFGKTFPDSQLSKVSTTRFPWHRPRVSQC